MYNHCNFPLLRFQNIEPSQCFFIIVDDAASCLRMSAGSWMINRWIFLLSYIFLCKKNCNQLYQQGHPRHNNQRKTNKYAYFSVIKTLIDSPQ